MSRNRSTQFAKHVCSPLSNALLLIDPVTHLGQHVCVSSCDSVQLVLVSRGSRCPEMWRAGLRTLLDVSPLLLMRDELLQLLLVLDAQTVEIGLVERS